MAYIGEYPPGTEAIKIVYNGRSAPYNYDKKT